MVAAPVISPLAPANAKMEAMSGRGGTSDSDGLSLHDALARALEARAAQPCGPDGPRTKGRPRSAEAHAAILTATLDLLVDCGYDALSIEAVAARAHVGKATVYRRWPSKGALVVEMLETIASGSTTPDTGNTIDDLHEFVENIARGFSSSEYGDILSGLAAELARNDSIAEIFRENFLRPRRHAAQEIIERGIARGDLRADVDIDLVLDLLAAPFYYRKMLSGATIDDEVGHALVDLVLRGVAAADRGSSGPQ